jgi:hypothetical protein
MMTEQQPAVQAPKHPLAQCTTFELRDYRAELEHEIQEVSPDAPAAADLRRLLDDVLREQEARRRLRRAS